MNKSSVVSFFTSQRKVALALGISEQAVSLWGDVIPKGAALELEKVTNGALKCDLSLYQNNPRRGRRQHSAEA